MHRILLDNRLLLLLLLTSIHWSSRPVPTATSSIFDVVTWDSSIPVTSSTLDSTDGTYPSELHCTHRGQHALSYSEFAGIMVGMLSLGLLSDVIGRVRAGIVTSTIAFISVMVMAFYQNSDINKQFSIFAVFFGIYGFGVGGEYPISATNAAMHHYEEIVVTGDAEEDRSRAMIVERKSTARRGETIAMAFAMQGVGATVGSLFCLILIYFAGQTQVDWYVLFYHDVVVCLSRWF